MPNFSQFNNYFLLCSIYGKVKDLVKTPSVEAASLEETRDADKLDDILEENELKPSIKKKKIGFRERKIMEYENRIRHYSTP